MKNYDDSACTPNDWMEVDLMVEDWAKTNSHVAYWYDQLRPGICARF